MKILLQGRTGIYFILTAVLFLNITLVFWGVIVNTHNVAYAEDGTGVNSGSDPGDSSNGGSSGGADCGNDSGGSSGGPGTTQTCPDGSAQPSHQECINDGACTTVYDSCPLTKPTNLTAVCDGTTHVATISWSLPSSATYSLLRVADTAYSFTGCSSPLGCWGDPTGPSNGAATSPLTIPGLYGNYTTWAHACDGSGCSGATSQVPFSCVLAGDITATGCSVTSGSTCGVVESWTSSGTNWSGAPLNVVNVVDNATGGYYTGSPVQGTSYTLDQTNSGGRTFNLPVGTYTLTLNGYSGSGFTMLDYAVVTVTNGSSPDLTASAISPTTATAGAARTFSSTITNNSAVGTGSNFHNLFQICSGTGSGGTCNGTVSDIAVAPMPALAKNPFYNFFASVLMSALGAGGSASAQDTYTFPSSGTYGMRVCANMTAAGVFDVVPEGNYGDNCGSWTNISVSSSPNPPVNNPPSCTVSGTSATLAWSAVTGATYQINVSGLSACPSGWSTSGGICYTNTGTTNSATVSGVTPGASTVAWVYTTVGGVTNTAVVPYPTGASFICNVSSCVNGSSCTSGANRCGMVNTGTCTSGSCPVSNPTDASCPVLTLTSSPSRVRSGEPSTITWSASNVNSCTLSGPTGTLSSNTSGTTNQTINGQSNFTLSCVYTLSPGNTATMSTTTTVRLVPTEIEPSGASS